VFARHSIEYALERYFPRPHTTRPPVYTAAPRRQPLPEPTFDTDVQYFTAPGIKELETKARRTKGRGSVTDERDVFLDYMFGF
jgi:hypothetical protein